MFAIRVGCTGFGETGTMKGMTARQPRRTRRRAAPATTLPRPLEAMPDVVNAEPRAATRPSAGRGREHHVTNDYSYIHKDLLTVSAVGVVVVAFIIGMSFLV